jgi:hypothetical protein
MQSLLVKAFSGLSGICSIAGFFVLFLKDKDKFLIAAIVYSVAITAFFVALTILVYRALSVKFKDKKYRKIATLQTFTCNDGVNVSFETRRLIQSKTPFLDEVECENSGSAMDFLCSRLTMCRGRTTRIPIRTSTI